MNVCPDELIPIAFISRSRGTRSEIIACREGCMIEFTVPCRNALANRCQNSSCRPNQPAARIASSMAFTALYACASWITFFLFARSATTPPIGDTRSEGTAFASAMVPSAANDPVMS